MVHCKGLCVLFSLVLVAPVEPKTVKNAIHELLSDDEVEKVFGTSPSEVPVYDVAHPVEVNHRGDFLSHDVSHSNDDVEDKRNRYFQISAFGKKFHLSLKLNTDQLLTPDFVTEIRNNGKSRYEKSVDHCHFIGHVVTSNGPGAKVALSNCDGLTGVIKDKREVLMIKPLPKRLGLSKRAHVVYQRSDGDIRRIGQELGLDVRPAPLLDEEDDESEAAMDDYCNSKYYIESLVVTDKNMVAYHGSTKLLKNYVLTLMNIVQGLIKDGSIGADIAYVLNRLMILETDEPNLIINSHAENTLSSFCKWTKGQNTPSDSDKSHFDHAALITRTALCAKSYDPTSSSCESLLGLADLRGMCNADTSCVLSTDSGLGTAFTIAHETGHNLGAEHDNEGNVCPDAVNIMARKASGKSTGYEWSTCSKNYITQFLRGSGSDCLKDNPGQRAIVPTDLPGKEYTLNDQCKLMVKGSTGFCNQPGRLKEACSVLWCIKPGGSCETNNEPAAEGSNCGTNPRMWCRRGICVPYGSEGPKAVDGGFSAWSNWESCSHTCGGGIQTRTRQCNNPSPQHGGKTCRGACTEYKYCVNQKCSSSVPDPRMTACMSKRNKPFNGLLYNWVYNPKLPVSDKDRCKLICEAPDQNNQMTFSTLGLVQNGVKCDGNGPNGVCIDGRCKPVGCDNVIGSKAMVDICGVCKGDGTSCTVNTIEKTFNKIPDNDRYSPEYQTIVTIPKGARDIEINESDASKNYLALETTTTNKGLLNTNYVLSHSRVFEAAGTSFSYSIKPDGKEFIKAKGPLTEGIGVKFLVESWTTKYKVSYRYKMVFPVSRDVSENPNGQYKWIIKSQGCSAKCGGGKSLVTATCVRVHDGSPVRPDLCDGIKPDVLSTECNTHPCPPRWKVGQWSDCSKTCNDGSLGEKSREVTCVMTSAGEEELIDDADCQDPKPAVVSACGNNACPAEWIAINTTPCSATCGRGITRINVVCQKIDTNGQKKQVPDGECPGDDKPPTSLTCNTHIPCNA